MKTLSQLQDFFYENIYPNLEHLEKQRESSVSFLKTLAIFLIVCATIVFTSIIDTPLTLNTLLLVVSIPFTIFFIAYIYNINLYKDEFKNEVIEKLVKFVEPSLFYSKDGLISRYEYNRSLLFPNSIDKYDGDDLIKGNIEGVNIKFSELHTQKKKKSSKGHEYNITVFKGLFFIADFNKYFKGTTIVIPDKSEKFLGSLSHIFQSFSSRGELVKLDNPNFEKEFVVYSSDQIEARYILSHSLMDSILDLKKLVKEDISMSFNGSNIYIAIHKNSSTFEPRIYKKMTNFDDIKDYFQTISLIVEIVKTLKLDVKIWSKR